MSCYALTLLVTLLGNIIEYGTLLRGATFSSVTKVVLAKPNPVYHQNEILCCSQYFQSKRSMCHQLAQTYPFVFMLYWFHLPDFYGLLSILETHSIRPVGESNDKDFHFVICQALISTELISALKQIMKLSLRQEKHRPNELLQNGLTHNNCPSYSQCSEKEKKQPVITVPQCGVLAK